MKPQTSPLLTGLLTLLASWCLAQTPSAAFHDGGTSNCATCHVMHASQDGQVVMVGSEVLLLAASSSDLCLTCHGPNGVFGLDPKFPPPEKGAGNFVFLLEDNLNDASDGLASPLSGEAAGHSIVSMDMGTEADSRWSEAPGGIFPSYQLGCTSCHDPHGNTNFRLLHGVGAVQGGITNFIYPAPQAVGLDISDPMAVEADDRHTAYQAGMSQWCANCHGLYHDVSPTSNFGHVTDEVLGNIEITIYNRYNGDADPFGAIQTTAYLKDVPFEQPGGGPTSTAGPSSGSRLMCLTCHRAHASSAPAAGRWDMRIAKLETDGDISGSLPIPNPYPGDVQGPLCRKCHPKGQKFTYDYNLGSP